MKPPRSDRHRPAQRERAGAEQCAGQTAHRGLALVGECAAQSQDTRGRAGRERFVVWCLSSERDHGALECSCECKGNRVGGRARRDRPVSAACVDQADEALDERSLNAVELAPDGMVLSLNSTLSAIATRAMSPRQRTA
jgi:hypothetical protein